VLPGSQPRKVINSRAILAIGHLHSRFLAYLLFLMLKKVKKVPVLFSAHSTRAFFLPNLYFRHNAPACSVLQPEILESPVFSSCNFSPVSPPFPIGWLPFQSAVPHFCVMSGDCLRISPPFPLGKFRWSTPNQALLPPIVPGLTYSGQWTRISFSLLKGRLRTHTTSLFHVYYRTDMPPCHSPSEYLMLVGRCSEYAQQNATSSADVGSLAPLFLVHYLLFFVPLDRDIVILSAVFYIFRDLIGSAI